jgi:hypothetical protein
VASALTPYLLSSTAASTYQTISGMSAYLSKAGNLAGLTNLATARDNLNLGTLNNPVFAGVTAQGAGLNVSNLTPTSLSMNHTGFGSFVIQPSSGITFPNGTTQTTAFTTALLSGYATESWVTAGFAPLARALPGSGTVGQVLTKQSGADYDVAFQTLIPGDRYLTSSTTSLTINNANKTLTVGTGLSYTTQQDIVIAHDAANHMHARVLTYNSGTGVMDVDVLTHSGSGTYATWTVNVGGAPALASVVWGDITGTLGDQTDLATALNAKLEITDAASTYQTIAGMSSYLTTADASTTYYPLTNPDGFITSSALSGYATESWVTSQGYITSSALTGYATESWVSAGYYPLTGNPSGFLTSASLSGYALLSGATFTGKVNTVASTTTAAGFNVPHATAAPTTPVNGDIWTTTSGLFMRQNGATRQYVDLDGTQTINGTKTFSASTQTLGNSTGAGTINIGTGATVSGSTRTINIGTASAAGSTNAINIGGGSGTSTTTLQGNLTTTGTSTDIANSTAAQSIFIGSGTTTTGNTKTIGIGANGNPGSTTNITLGTTGGTTNITLNGNTNGVTQTAGNSTTLLATTAFVTTANNLKANIASPSLTGTPLSTTAAADTNTTQIATTAFVIGQAGSATPLQDGTAAVGTSLRYARQDHVHGTDTTRAPLASPTFTGVPTAPTATLGTNTTQIATTAFVTAAVPAIATAAQTNNPSSNTVVMSPDKVRQMLMFPGFQEFYGGGVNATSGAGASVSVTGNRTREFAGPSASVAGYSTFVFDTTTSSIGFYASVRGGSAIGKNFNRPFWFGSRTLVAFGDANNLFRAELGGRNLVTTSGDPVQQGIGWKVAGGGGNAIVFYLRTRSAGNGGTYSQVTTTFTPLVTSPRQYFDWYITHDGASTSQMYVNDVLVGTLTASFAGFQEEFNFYSDRIEQTASAATQMQAVQLPTRVFFSQ